LWRYGGLKSQDVKVLTDFLRLFSKTTPYGKIFNSFHRDIDQRVLFQFREIWPTEIGEMVRCLT